MRLSPEEFNGLVRQAFKEMPLQVRQTLKNLDILVEDWPSPDTLLATEAGNADGLLGLYSGVPLPERGISLPSLPDTITLFRRPIESACSSKEAIVREIRVTLLHEVGHYLGLAEEDLERLGYG